MKLTPEEWEEAADLCQQFCDQCEIAFEDVAPHSKKWVLSRLTQLTKLADMRSIHPRRATTPPDAKEPR